MANNDYIGYNPDGDIFIWTFTGPSSKDAVAVTTTTTTTTTKVVYVEYSVWTEVEYIYYILIFGSASGGGFGVASGNELCTVDIGFDQPGNDLDSSYVASAAECCDSCAGNDKCKSWVWNSKTHECKLKSIYDDNNLKADENSVGYNPHGEIYVWSEYGISSTDKSSEWDSWSAQYADVDIEAKSVEVQVEPIEIDVTVPEKDVSVETVTKTISLEDFEFYYGLFGAAGGFGYAIGGETCTLDIGFDQKSEDIPGSPFYASYVAECCDKCAENNECNSWVWNHENGNCHLKYVYDANSLVEDEEFVGFNPKGQLYVWSDKGFSSKDKSVDWDAWTSTYDITVVKSVVVEPAVTVTKEVEVEIGTTAEKSVIIVPEIEVVGDYSTWTLTEYTYYITMFGIGNSGGGFGIAHGPELCRLVVGYDQKGNDLLSNPLVLPSAAECCDSCAYNEQCKSWVWNKATYECFLKDKFDETSIAYDINCVSYYNDGGLYVWSENGPSSHDKSVEWDAFAAGFGVDVDVDFDASKEVEIDVEPELDVTKDVTVEVITGETEYTTSTTMEVISVEPTEPISDYDYFMSVFGSVAGWGTATGIEICIVEIGFDQKGNDLYDKPFISNSAAECCDVCADDESKSNLYFIIIIK